MMLFTKLGVLLLCMSVGFMGAGVCLMVEDSLYLLGFYMLDYMGVDMYYELMVDWVSLVYGGVVLFVSGSVMVYSNYYMEGDKTGARFGALSSAFVFSMILMVTSGGFVSLMVGWDGLGVISYCLVIYYQNMSSSRAGLITIFVNRIGDVFLLLVIGMLLSKGSWSFVGSEMGMLVVGLVVMAGATKSAQFPFSAWLPEAMAAPTPVSSLVHSSTLVTAGIYLMIRMEGMSGDLMSFIVIMGALTMLMSGVSAFYEMDMKKVIALSTLSQLGFMSVTLGVGVWYLAYFHMVMHAFFKALMFLSLGGIIHMSRGEQDGRCYIGAGILTPSVGQGLLVSVVCLMGMPFLGAFFSKEIVLEYMSSNASGFILIFCYVVGVGASFIYGARLLIMVGFMSRSGMVLMNLQTNKYVRLSIGLLMSMAIVSGALLFWLLDISELVLLPSMLKLGKDLLFFSIGAFMLFYMNSKWYMMKRSGAFSMFMGNFWNSKELSYYVVLGSSSGLSWSKMSELWSGEVGGGGLSLLVVWFTQMLQLFYEGFLFVLFVSSVFGMLIMINY